VNASGIRLGALLLAGCAATSTSSSDRIALFDKQIDAVAAREHRCESDARSRAADELSQIAATPDTLVDLDTGTTESNYYFNVQQCEVEADRDGAQLSASEREEYRLQQQEQDRTVLMTTLLASRPH
jgi:hypothetical protein